MKLTEERTLVSTNYPHQTYLRWFTDPLYNLKIISLVLGGYERATFFSEADVVSRGTAVCIIVFRIKELSILSIVSSCLVGSEC